MATVENRATELGYTWLACDTAEGAVHLVQFYHEHDYQIVDRVYWDGKNVAASLIPLWLGITRRIIVSGIIVQAIRLVRIVDSVRRGAGLYRSHSHDQDDDHESEAEEDHSDQIGGSID